MEVVRKVYSAMLDKPVESEEGDLGHLESIFQQIRMVTGLEDVDMIVEKFLTREQRAKDLESMKLSLEHKVMAAKAEQETLETSLQVARAFGAHTISCTELRRGVTNSVTLPRPGCTCCRSRPFSQSASHIGGTFLSSVDNHGSTRQSLVFL